MKEIYVKKEDAVSPVIATILMVAITVVLAATVYILVSHYTSTGATTPFAGSLAEQSSSASAVSLVLTFTTPGSPIPVSDVNIQITVNGAVTQLVSKGVFTAGAGITGITISNPDGSPAAFGTTPQGNIESGAILSFALGSGTSLSGDTITLTVSGYSGSASTVIS